MNAVWAGQYKTMYNFTKERCCTLQKNAVGVGQYKRVYKLYKRTLLHVTKTCWAGQYKTMSKLYKKTLLHVTKERCWSGAVPNNAQTLEVRRAVPNLTKECCWSGAVPNTVQTLELRAVPNLTKECCCTLQKNAVGVGHYKTTCKPDKRMLLGWGSTKQRANFPNRFHELCRKQSYGKKENTVNRCIMKMKE